MTKEEKLEALKTNIKELDSLAVAFSAGVDSTFLLKVAHDVLQEKCIALRGESYAFPDSDGKEADDFCKKEGIRQITFEAGEASKDVFLENAPDRCYHCKRIMFEKMKGLAKEEHISFLAEGSNADDLLDYRPGRNAIEELKVLSPLLQVGLTKEEIRELSKEMGLSTASKPSFACLASRVSYGEAITKEKLIRIQKAEAYLKELGFCYYRVRLHGDLARIEVNPKDIEKLASEKMRNQVTEYFKGLGFLYVTLDLQGYRMGSLNEAIDTTK